MVQILFYEYITQLTFNVLCVRETEPEYYSILENTMYTIETLEKIAVKNILNPCVYLQMKKNILNFAMVHQKCTVCQFCRSILDQL